MDSEMILVTEEPRGPSQLIEIPVPAQVVSKVVIPIIQQLISNTEMTVIIKALRLITDDVLTNAPTLGGPNATLAELQKISLTLYAMGWEKGQLIPILTLNDQFTEGSGVPYRHKTTKLDNWKNVDWNKSFLQYSNGTPSSGAAYNVLIEVEYLRFDKNNKIIEGVQ